MKILLVGRNGQVGYELKQSLQGLGEVVTLDRAGMDLADLDCIRKVIRAIRPGLIVNAAAYTAVDLAEKESDLAMRVNADAPAIMAEEAVRLGAAMVHYSTDYVFDGSKKNGYVENDLPAPQNVYGSTKLAGEQAIQATGVPHLIFRTSWVYGLFGKNFLLTIRRLSQERDQLRVVADQFGAPTWSRTIAMATRTALAHLGAPNQDHEAWRSWGGIYHLTGQGKASWYEFARAIVMHDPMSKRVEIMPITTAEYPLPTKRPANSVLCCEKFIQRFGALPVWKDALQECLGHSINDDAPLDL